MDCPVCKTTRLMMTERAGVEIDYCPQCRGVWLDRGELDKILERSQQEAAPAARAETHAPQRDEHGHRNSHGHSQQQKPYRKKSIWEELFD
ncbi:hypothetical protein SAMN02745857_03965 [Andreprevotia lacus DSM 23236]|uniref:Transcription factor zinc-finger domain-containing protein n=2 Tax=Andreprevotia TaxID=397275 RepID=A0A1W1Y0H0_9NEIS|nr:hypothetical protein SAMN02745857_03965 [Andreprevotia lacus DSM 23236]